MPPALTAQLRSLQATANKLSLGQKVLAVLGVGILLLGGTALYRSVTAPTYAPLMTNLAAADASAITTQLTADGVPFQVTDGGATVMVPADQVVAERLKVAAAGLPANQASGYSLLDAQGVTSSQFQQKVTYQRAVEGELAKTVEGLAGVQTAVVHLAVPEETVFTDTKGTTTASVLVENTPGATLSDDQVQAIIHLVSSSVPGLAADQVTVSDSKGRLLSAAGEGATGATGDAATTAYNERTAAAVQAMLDKVLGPGKATASVSGDLDYDRTQRTTETFSTTPGTPPLSATTSKETYGGGAGSAAAGGALGTNGVLGMDGQETGTAGATGSSTAGSGYVKESSTSDNAVNKTTDVTAVAPGTVKKQSIAVVVDTAAAAKVGIPNLTQMVAAAAGVDTARGDVLSVTQAPFDTTASDAAAADLAAAKAEQASAAQFSLIKQGAIALGVLLLAVVLLIMWRRAKKKQQREVVDLGELERLYPAAAPQVAMAGAPAVAGAEAPVQLPAAGPEPAALRRAEFGQLVDNQPAEVAELLRGWLATPKKG